MKVAVIAANGRSGRAVVAELIQGGYEVVAGVRGSHRLPPHSRLTIKQCDATSLAAIQHLVTGADAIVSCIGRVRGSRANVQTTSTMNIVRAARKLGITRVVSLTGTGVRFPGDTPSSTDKLLNWLVAMIDPIRIRDGRDHAEVLRASGLEWTIIRVLKLTNRPARHFSLSLHGPGKLFVPRAEVAQAIHQVLSDHSFVGKAPVVSARLPQSNS